MDEIKVESLAKKNIGLTNFIGYPMQCDAHLFLFISLFIPVVQVNIL